MKIGLLGRVVIEPAEGKPVEVRARQPALLLARLVLERPRPIDRGELADLLWPDELPAHWEGASRQVVTRARRALVDAGCDPRALVSVSGVVQLDLPGEPDVDVEQARAAVVHAEAALLDGRLADAEASAGATFETLSQPFLAWSDGSWARSWRERIDASAQRALHISAHAKLADGRPLDAEAMARVAAERDPYDEEATRLLMAARDATGNRAGALHAYEALRRLLDEELGVRPSDETESRYRALLGAAPEALPRAERSRRLSPLPADARPFIGRVDELHAIERSCAAARTGSPQIVVVTGEPGVGKTRLLVESGERAAASGGLLLWGRCDPKSGVAYGPFSDVFAQLVDLQPEVVARVGRAAEHLELLLPDVVEHSSSLRDLPPALISARLFNAATSALREAVADPLVVVLDDMQWADADTVSLFSHLAPRLEGCNVVLALAMRERSSLVDAVLAQLQRSVPTTTLPLAGLSVDDVAALIEQSDVTTADGVRAAAEAVTRRTGGNALYVTQLVREAEGTNRPLDARAVPAEVALLLQRRLSALDRALTSTLVIAAVIGKEFEIGTVEACLDHPGDQLLDQLEELVAQHFVDERGSERFGFTHDLVRDAVLTTVSATRLARINRRVAVALESAGADPATIAHHYLHAGPSCVRQAMQWSLDAGDDAIVRAAWDAAREHFQVALELATELAASGSLAPVRARCRAAIGLGLTLRALGRPAEARATLDLALKTARSHDLRREIAAATLALVGGGGRGVAFEMADAERRELLESALASIDDLGASARDLSIEVLAELAVALVLTDEVDRRAQLTERCLALARKEGTPEQLARARWARRVALMGPWGTVERAGDAEQTVGASALISPQARLAAQLALVEDHLELGNRDAADTALLAAEREASSLDHPYWSWATSCWRTLTTIIDGDLDLAEARAFQSVDLQPENPEAVAALGVNLIDVRLFQGRVGEMVELLAVAADDNPHIPTYRAVLALCALEAGDRELALASFGHFADQGFELPPDSNWLLGTAVLADVCATLGDTRAAPALTALLEPFRGRQVILNCYGGGGSFWGPVSHHLARLAAVEGRHDDAASMFAQAEAESRAFGAPLFAERTRAAATSSP